MTFTLHARALEKSMPKSDLKAKRLSSLKGEGQFRKVSGGFATRTPHFILRRLPYKPRYGEKWEPHAVIGIVVSKKTLPHAVDRNRARRRVREALRLLELTPCRAMLILNASVLTLEFDTLKTLLRDVFAKPLPKGPPKGLARGSAKGSAGDKQQAAKG